ncbi:hypothetical protein K438DRAFT_1751640 [Mycena galopus ATCC 62051]|nr:hypothetical protein K438DRAFT_1751640 [Mycena galopus ATCC 62051]
MRIGLSRRVRVLYFLGVSLMPESGATRGIHRSQVVGASHKSRRAIEMAEKYRRGDMETKQMWIRRAGKWRLEMLRTITIISLKTEKGTHRRAAADGRTVANTTCVDALPGLKTVRIMRSQTDRVRPTGETEVNAKVIADLRTPRAKVGFAYGLFSPPQSRPTNVVRDPGGCQIIPKTQAKVEQNIAESLCPSVRFFTTKFVWKWLNLLDGGDPNGGQNQYETTLCESGFILSPIWCSGL